MGQKVIMIVDDSKVSRMMISAYISSLKPQWQIIETGSADAALRQLSMHTIDYLSVDLNMPGMDGLGLIRHMSDKDSGRIRLALLTANVQEQVLKQVEKYPVRCFIKPINEQVIKQMIDYFETEE